MQFNRISIKNLLSVGDLPVEIDFTRNALTLVTGENGAGKSTVIIEGVYFALFGSSYRGVKKAELINSVNRSGLVVTLEFTVQGHTYSVSRGIKPNIFSITKDGTLLADEPSAKAQQDKLDAITGLSENMFAQMVAISSTNYRPFLTLNLPERREFVEKALPVELYSVALQLAKRNLSVLKTELTDANVRYTSATTSLKTAREANSKARENTQDQINFLESSISNLKEPFLTPLAEKDSITQNLKDSVNVINEKLLKIQPFLEENVTKPMSEITAQVNIKQKLIDFLEHNSSCPTCKQDIDIAFSNSEREKLSKEIMQLSSSKVMLEEKRQKILSKQSELRAELSARSNELQDMLDKWRDETNKYNAHKAQLDSLNRQLDSLKATAQTTQLVDEDSINKEVVAASAEMENINAAITITNHAIQVLGDSGIKREFVKSILPMLNQEISQNMTALGAAYTIALTEDFDAVVVGRFAGEFTYASLSMGERARCDMAVLLAWHKVTEIANGKATSLLLLDEVGDSSLDSVGQAGLVDLLEKTNKNVFMISHRDVSDERLTGKIIFKKEKGFTVIV